MKIIQRDVKGIAILDLEGSVTIGEGDVQMREAILGLMELGRVNVLLNLARVSYMDSSGIGELLSCLTKTQERGGRLKLLNISTKIKNLLHIAQILSVFEYFNDEEQAVSSFQQ